MGRLVLGLFVTGLALLPSAARGASPCAADIQKFCPNVTLGGGRIQACLKEHEAELSPECAARKENLQKRAGALLSACRSDMQRFCSDVSPGQGHVAHCLSEHRNDLSATCTDQLRKARQSAAR